MHEPIEQRGSAPALQQAIDGLPLGVLVFDTALRLVAANRRAAALLDLPQHLLAARTPLADMVGFAAARGDLGPGDPQRLAAARLASLLQSGGFRRERLGVGGHDVEIASARADDDGLVVSVADLSGRIEAERALAEANATLEARVAERTAALTLANAALEEARRRADAANQEKTRFLAAASHDLLQPLNAARLYTATLVERAQGTPHGELARSIESALNAVEDIMSALLDMSRIDAGALRPDPAPFHIRDLVRKVAVEFAPLAAERSITLRLVDSSAVVFTDKALVARIVQNLVSNAIKYTRPGGRVLVGCRRKGGGIRLDVIDTGIGFARDQHRLVFAEFARLEQGSSMAHGLGLGLSIVERLSKLLGLPLEMASVEEQGSRFSVYLPLGEMPRPAAIAARAEPPTRLGRLRILCVDNERDVLDAMESLLTAWGCEVRSAQSLKEVDRGNLLIGWLPDLALVDYHLDQTSGLDAVQWLRQNVGGQLPAALVTADRTPAVRALAEVRGIPVITKPVRPAALRATINALVKGRG
ncbi:MAG TPA: ATP-binding protein [Devosia sp.]|nr:ATP-binding protein [Devosia sp.]